MVSEKLIKDVLFGVGPVVIAWIVGGVGDPGAEPARRLVGPRGGRALEAITTRDAMIIGGAQVLALWPGTSRSLVTIVAALLLGLSMAAAVEFSFLLGFVTLSAATRYETLKHGKPMVDTFGIAIPLLGLVVAFVAAVVSIRWMVSYLQPARPRRSSAGTGSSSPPSPSASSPPARSDPTTRSRTTEIPLK